MHSANTSSWLTAKAALNIFFSYTIIGLSSPFIAKLLEFLGYNHQQIGLFMGATSVFGIIMPMIAGRLVDKGLTIKRQLQISLGGTLCLAALLLAYQRLPGNLILSLLLLFFLLRPPLLSLYDTLAVDISNLEPARSPQIYRTIRVMGSIGFMLAASLLGKYLSAHQERFFGFLLLTAALSLLVTPLLPSKSIALLSPPPPETTKPLDNQELPQDNFWRQLTPLFWLWLSAMMLHFLCMGPYSYGFSLFLQEVNIPDTQIGLMWSLALIAEIGCFWLYPYIYKLANYQSNRLLLLAMLSHLLRFGLMGLIPTKTVIILAQLLHGPGFAIFWSAAMQALNEFNSRLSAGRYQGSYQGLFAMCVSGAASVLGMTLGGILHEHQPFAKVLLYTLPGQILGILLLGVYIYCAGKTKNQPR